MRHPTSLAFAAILMAATLMSSSSASELAQDPLDASARKEVAEMLAQKLADQYAHADLGEKMAQAVRNQLAAGAYDKIDSATEFARALQADIRAVVGDKHLRVSFERQPMPGAGPPRGGSGGAGRPPSASAMLKQNGAIRRAQILDGNVGYLEVNAVMARAEQAIAAAFAFLHNTDALIIDLRGNGGGAPETVARYMSYLSDGPPYVVMRVKRRQGDRVEETRTTDLGALSYGTKKPVFVLTSSMTFSGGEELAYDIQAFKRGTVVGEVTGGGANPGGMQRLSHGFGVFLPNGYAIHPVTGTNWEGVGVKPDVEVPAEQALIEAHRLAVERLRASATEPRERAALEAFGSKLTADSKAAAGAARASAARLSEEQRQLLGFYAPPDGLGPSFSIVGKDGSLVLEHTRGRPPSRLVAVSPTTYRMQGLPEDFTATFITAEQGKIRLLLIEGGRLPVIVEKK